MLEVWQAVAVERSTERNVLSDVRSGLLAKEPDRQAGRQAMICVQRPVTIKRRIWSRLARETARAFPTENSVVHTVFYPKFISVIDSHGQVVAEQVVCKAIIDALEEAAGESYVWILAEFPTVTLS